MIEHEIIKDSNIIKKKEIFYDSRENKCYKLI